MLRLNSLTDSLRESDASEVIDATHVGFRLGKEPADPAVDSERAASRVLGERCGLVRNCHRASWKPGLPVLSLFAATGPVRAGGHDFSERPVGSGSATTPEQARIAAISEVVERYAAMAPVQPHDIVNAPFREVSDIAIEPERFAQLSPPRGRERSAFVDVPVEWVWGYSLSNNAAALVPAALVHLSRRRPPNAPDFPGTSGFASHSSLPHAVLAGLLEVLERDALAIAWRQRHPLHAIDIPESDELAGMAPLFANTDAIPAAYLVPSDAPVPVVFATLTSDAQYPFAATGAACRPSLASAVQKALLEAGQSMSWMRIRGASAQEPLDGPRARAAFYARRSGAARLHLELTRCATSAEGVQTNRQVASEAVFGSHGAISLLSSLVSQLREDGREVIVAELTPPDAGSAGFRVVRVLVPGALDACADPAQRTVGDERLDTVGVKLGLPTLRYAEVNTLPFPLG